MSAFVGTKSGLDAQTRQEALQLTGEIANSINSKEALQELRSCVGRQGFNLLDIFISKAYAGGVCERYSTAAINLCLEGFDKLRLAVVESGASGLEYFSKRIEQDPEGFEQIARLLDFMPSSLAMAPLENEIKAEIEKNGGDLDAINRMVNDFISRQTQAVENGEITPEVAASIAVAATIIVAKITPKSVRGKVVNKAIASSKTLFNAAKQKLGGTAGTSKFGFDSSNVESKLKGYLLDPLHPQNQTKANWFSQALGFNQSNWQELASQLRFDPKTAVATKATQYGQTYEQVIAITGTNGKTINTTFVFMKDNSGTVRLVTGIPAKK
ncbi:DUF6883 domain-containing protein [Brucella rhizosphaerae]|uniref:DUF6883 domain-containing protein n=1 Tax=Brucella rhizosphaerae TaxID=571254 RepID=UPI0036134073